MHSAHKYLAAVASLPFLSASVPSQNVKASGGSAASPIFGITIPAGYRQWELVAVSHETAFDEFRGILGNAAAITAYRDGTLPFPDGVVLAKLVWKRVPSAEFPGAFVPGAASTVQFMVKDSKKYASTGGWGFGRFIGGKPVDEAQHRTCFACHQTHVKGRDFVFTRFAPWNGRCNQGPSFMETPDKRNNAAEAPSARDIRGPSPLVAIENEPPPKLIVDPPLPEPLTRGMVFIQYRTENLRVVPVFGKGALGVSPRLGHIHVTVDELPWHFVDASGEP